MGLEMYAFTTPEKFAKPTDFHAVNATEFYYWAKHPNLHGWMHELYRSKGGADPEFNLAEVELTLDDLERLDNEIRGGLLPETRGFFFGISCGDEVEDDLDFIAAARAAIEAGLTVYYTSWW